MSIMNMKQIQLSCWNVLADCYSYNMRGTKSETRSWLNRKPLISKILTEQTSDLIFLQEVDHYIDFFNPLLETLDKKVLYCQRPYKDDGSCIAYNYNRFVLLDQEFVHFDDLVENFPSQRNDYFKHNVALMAKFKDTYNDDKEFVASTAHLYWNPSKPRVKEAQAYFLKKKLIQFANNSSIILCGDFNSQPQSNTINILSQGQQKFIKGNVYCFPKFDNNIETKKEIILKGKDAKFLCDESLNKLARQLRLLGIDCALESEESYILRTSSIKRGSKDNYKLIFTQAMSEQRVLLTTSRVMREIANCPPSMLIKTADLDGSLRQICEQFEIELKPENFLTVCGKCGGAISNLDRKDHRLQSVALPTDDRPLYACVKCGQPYWWSNGPSSSPARAMRKASEIYEKVKNNGGSVEKRDAILESESLDIKFERRDDTIKGILKTKEFISEKNNIQDITTQLSALLVTNNNEIIENYASTEFRSYNLDEIDTNDVNNNNTIDDVELISTFYDYNGNHPDFTNWLDDFKGVLDYIYVSKDWTIHHARIQPNEKTIVESLPSDNWPSDHLLLQSSISL